METEVGSSIWFQLHLACALGADVLMLGSAFVAVLYLLQDRRLRVKKPGRRLFALPSIYTLDDMGIRLLTAAFALMTVGMVAGSILARELWGNNWYLDARQVLSVLVWFLFASVLIARFLAGWRGRRASIISVCGVIFMLIGHLSLSAVTRTRHNAGYLNTIVQGEEPHDR